jgi:hypothetical protein
MRVVRIQAAHDLLEDEIIPLASKRALSNAVG